MNDLISRKALIEALRKDIQEKDTVGQSIPFKTGMLYRQIDVIKIIEEQPTVEAVPVVHGEWILEEKAGVDYWCCSHCHKIRSEYYAKPKDNFCPNCGTYMRKKENKENDES